MSYIYVKDLEGFVVKKLEQDLQAGEIIISQEEYENLSGDKFYNENFGRGGKREGAGRKPKNGVVLKFQVRVSAKEKEFLDYARSHNINYDDLMEG